MDAFNRTRMLLGQEGMNKLQDSRVAVFGIGGVGGYAVEALVRSGIGSIDLIDNDVVCETNLNRQIIALRSTIGRPKVEVMKERIMDVNPECVVNIHQCFFLPSNAHNFDFSCYDYIVDCVDTVSAKLELVMKAHEAGVPIISSMGAGNKLNPQEFEVSDIYKTSVCPLARVMRYELKKRNIPHLKVVYSRENPIKPAESGEADCKAGSNAFVPSVAGLILASEVIKDLINQG